MKEPWEKQTKTNSSAIISRFYYVPLRIYF